MGTTSGNRAVPSHTTETRCISPTDKLSNRFLRVRLPSTISHLGKDKLSLFRPWEKQGVSACRNKAIGGKQEVRTGRGKTRDAGWPGPGTRGGCDVAALSQQDP